MAQFEIYKDQRREYRFRLITVHKDILGKSEGYTQKHNAENGIKSVKSNCVEVDNFTVFQSDQDKQYYFNLKAPENKKIILSSSRSYATEADAKADIESIKSLAPLANTVDKT